MAFTVDSVPNLEGKVAFVTGGNSGLGYETIKALSARGAHVLLAARNEEKAIAAREDILLTDPNASIEITELDLGSLASIRNAATSTTAKYPTIDILVNNAGLMAMPELTTEDGFESQFGVNHLGHWALTALLMPSLLSADAARVVTVTSTAHHFALRVNSNNPHMRGNYSSWGAYSQSKLANYYFAQGLHREFKRAGVPAASLLAHPGLSHTGLQVKTVAAGGAGRLGPYFMELAAKNGMSALGGALPQIRAAVDPAAKSGEFYGPRRGNTGDPTARPFLRLGASSAIASLWALSEKETGIALPILETPVTSR